MGLYSYFSIDQHCISELKHFVWKLPFRKSERKIVVSKETDEDTGEEVDKKRFVYQSAAKILRRRFDHDGYTYDALERDFHHNVKARIELAEEHRDDEESSEDVERDLALLRRAKFDSWLRALKQVLTGKEGGASKKIVEALQTFSYYQSDLRIDMWPNWPASSHSYLVRAVLEVVPDEWVCEHDLTEFVEYQEIEDFDDLEPDRDFLSVPKDVFDTAVEDIQELLQMAPKNQALLRLLHANIVTAYETFLAETAKRAILGKPAVLRRFIEVNSSKTETFKLSELFVKYEKIEELVAEQLDKLSFHNVDTAIGIFHNVLLVNFPKKELQAIRDGVATRHDIIHRNGRLQTSSKKIKLSQKTLERFLQVIQSSVETIDQQVKEALLDSTTVD